MKIKRNVTIIYSKDIKTSKNFYLDLLNLQIDLDLKSVVFFKEGIAIWEVKPSHILNETLGDNFNKSNGKNLKRNCL